MIVITGTIKVESEAEISSLRAALVARVERSKKDAGNIEYAFSQDLSDPTVVCLMEKWEDEASLQAHLEIPDQEFSQILAKAKIVSAVVSSCEAGNEKVLMSR